MFKNKGNNDMTPNKYINDSKSHHNMNQSIR
jgi:hypothetical protein